MKLEEKFYKIQATVFKTTTSFLNFGLTNVIYPVGRFVKESGQTEILFGSSFI